jgi:arabinan endo-1,5-alpha-L-arabinosidase
MSSFIRLPSALALLVGSAAVLIGLTGCTGTTVAAGALENLPAPEFREVTVHDPSVIRVDDMYYVFGSHLAAAKSTDLMRWEQVAEHPRPGNLLFPGAFDDVREAYEWVGERQAFWAPDVERLADGRFYYYYCVARIDQPRAALGLAVADNIEGPYENLGIIFKSGMWGEPSPDGEIYNPRFHPNAVDPHTFHDKNGKPWMVYGSYSGGMFIVEIDSKTGFPLPDQAYGKHLWGGEHSRIEAPFIQYSPDTDYYYLFVSYGGLGADDGYNMRVARSHNPDGPYLDSAGTDMATVRGSPGTLFDDESIQPHGVKLAGNYHFLPVEGEPADETTGHRSPGHNSTFHDQETGKYFNFFHTRFVGRGQEHQVRVHQMFLNEEGWFVMAPHRYAGETIGKYSADEIAGAFKFINHGKTITADVAESVLINLKKDGSISGTVSGKWRLSGDHHATLEIDGTPYKGVFVRLWDDDHQTWVMAFTALSGEGVPVWGSQVVRSVSR